MKTAWKIAWVVHRHFFAIAFQMVTEVSGGARNNFSSNLQRQKLATGIILLLFSAFFFLVSKSYYQLHKALTKKKRRTEGLLEWWQNGRWSFLVRISWQMQKEKRLNTCLPLCQHPNKCSAQRVIINYCAHLC